MICFGSILKTEYGIFRKIMNFAKKQQINEVIKMIAAIALDDIAPPIKACQKDEGREEIYQGRKPQEYSCTPRAFAFLSKLKIW